MIDRIFFPDAGPLEGKVCPICGTFKRNTKLKTCGDKHCVAKFASMERDSTDKWNGENKEMIRNKCVEMIKQQDDILTLLKKKRMYADRDLTYLGLSGFTFRMEKKLKSVGFKSKNVHIVERSRFIYEKMQKENKEKYQLHYHRGGLFEVVKQFAKPFSVINLDFCGPYGKDSEEIVKQIFVRALVENGSIIFLSILRARDSFGKSFFYKSQTFGTPFQEVISEDKIHLIREEALTRRILNIAYNNGYALEILDKYEYSDGVHSPMFFVAFGVFYIESYIIWKNRSILFRKKQLV